MAENNFEEFYGYAYEDLSEGQSAAYARTVTEADIVLFAGVSGDSLPRGLISACCGLFLATVGLDTIYGTERMIFGNYELMSGFNFIPVLIGLFALPEIIDHFARKGEGDIQVGALGRVGAGLSRAGRGGFAEITFS